MACQKINQRITLCGMILVWLSLLVPAFRVGAGEVPVEPQTAPKILLISSFHLSHKWTLEVNNVIMRELDTLPETPIVDYLELNSVRNRTSDYRGKFEPYRQMIRARKYDLVVAILDDAINLLIENLDSIPKDQPIVFCGYQELTPEFVKRHPNITGLAINFQVMKTIEMGLALMPDTEEVAVVTDDFPSGMLIHRRMQQEIVGFKQCKITLINGAEYSTQQMFDAVRKMPEKSFVVFCPWRNYARDGYASLLNVGQSLEKIGRPYLVITDVLLGQGALGGCVSFGNSNGKELAEIIRQVLATGCADAIPFVQDNGDFAADMAVMEKFALSAAELPADTLVINREPTLWESHREAVITAIAAILLLSVMIVALFLFHLRFRRLSHRMRNEQDSLISRLDNHVGNEQIINQCLKKITITGDSSEAIRNILETIGIHIGADRAYIFRYRDDRFADNIHEWVAPGILPEIDQLRQVNMNEFPFLQETFRKKCSMEVADTRHPEPGQEESAEFLLVRDVQSSRLSCIWDQGKLWGFVGVDFTRSLHTFTESDRQLLDNAVSLFLLARERRRQMTDLLNQKREQEVTNEFLNRAGEIAGITYFKGGADGNSELLGGSLKNTTARKKYGNFEEWLLAEDRPVFRKAKAALVSGEKSMSELICRSDVSGEVRTYKIYVAVYSREENIYIGIMQDVTESIKLTDEKNNLIVRQKAYVENEKIINGCLTQLVQDENFNQSIGHILNTLANQLDSDRAYYGNYAADGIYEVTHEWLNNGVVSLLEVRDPRFKKQFSIWRDQFLHNELLEIPDIQNSGYAEVLQEPGCRTLLCAPVTVNQELRGIVGLGFIRHRREISEFDENMIRSVAQIISLALQRDAKHRELEAAISDREAVFRNIGVPIMLFDRTGKLIRVNPAVCEMARKGADEILATPCHCTFCRQPEEPVWCPVRQVLNTRRNYEIEIELHDREYVIKAEPVLDEDGNVRNIIESAIDVTEINESKRQLEKSVQAEQAANRAKSYFLASMSHEIRTPLNAVIGFSELLKEGGLAPEEQIEYLNSISLAGNSLLRLINDVLDLSKLEADQTELTPQPTDLAALLKEIQAIFQYKAQQKKIFFQLDCPENLPTLILDNLRLRQILLNLAGNAVKFTDRGGISVNAEFRPVPGCAAGTLSIGIQDTGVGIPEEAQEKIFKPFEQSDVMRDTHIHGGTGLGLAISRRLAERMNGRITLTSRVGNGSCFTLMLRNVEIAATANAAKEEKRAISPPPPGKPRLLLVDDVRMNLKVLEAMLRKLQIECVLANSGQEALELLAEDWDFSLVLTDLWMPEMNGTELAQKIHANPVTAGIPIDVVTADSQITGENSEEFQDILLKPVTLEKLQTIIRRNHRPESSGDVLK